ncbi:translocation/assembly module TamB domain-containing protein [uncultured Thioclava sp.]|uniref:translocation/assembly module TamB domain-containing protein n=1 Tax=uncultured Thioclava sp. TaxID=473858 RepID=UPI0025FDBDCF|nr:translocation/assembly module TamB domain-containing protein [uncultured Thioclava sp.]
MKRVLLSLALVIWPLGGFAQDSTPADQGAGAATEAQTQRDRSYLTGLIEDSLSGAGRSVRLDGFAGALSSRATFTSLTISDDQGAWLTIKDGAIQWNRTALLTGKIEIDELSANEIDLPRLPGTSATGTPAPSPEAKPFSLPDLPVALKIGKIDAKKVIIGQTVIGEAATVKITGSMSLAGGEGKAKLDIDRIDGQKGKFSLTGAYDNGSRELGLDLLVDEGKGGIISKMIGLPGRPAITLAVSGSGPIDKFSADVVLSTDGQQRLAGKVSVSKAVPEGAVQGVAPETGFSAEFSGDVSPLLPPEYRDFFGKNVSFVAQGARTATGQTNLSALDIKSRALNLQGSAVVGASGLPHKFDLTGQLGLGEGQEVLLPISGVKTWVQSGNIKLAYDKATGDGWSLSGRLNALRREDGTKMLSAILSGSGRIRQGSPSSVGGTVVLSASGIELADEKLAKAVGPFVSGKAVFSWQQDQPLRLSQLSLLGRGYRADANLRIADLNKGAKISGTAKFDDGDISALSDLAGRPLSGAVLGSISGNYTVLTGAFDANLDVTGQDVTINQPQADAALKGSSKISLSASRNENGLTIKAFNATTRAVVASAQGTLSSKDGVLNAHVEAKDLSLLGGGYRGGLSADAKVTRLGETFSAKLDAETQNLAIGQAEIDTILAGKTAISLAADYTGGRVKLQNLSVKNPQVTISANGAVTDTNRQITLDARLANAALLAPGFPGPLSLSGTVTDDGTGYQVNISGDGPGGTSAKVTGQVASDFSNSDLTITGSAQTALANSFIAPRSVQGPLSFDLRMNGKPGLPALSGTITANDTRIVAPNLGMVLEKVNTRVQLSDGKAQLGVTGQLGSGGTLAVNGPIDLSPPFNGNLTIRLDRARLRDPELYDTYASGTITMDGPLSGGAKIAGKITLADTELRVPSSGISGAASVPDGLTHVGENAAVRQTLIRAGLLDDGKDNAGAKTSSARPYPMDVTIAASRGIFVRGRGLDAELGGSLRITGTSANVVPIGQFNLVRGRLDILGQRFTLNKGQIALQGALVPYIDFAAVTTQGDYTIAIAISGQANSPEVSFSSSPDLPQDEVLSRLIFGRGVSSLSAIQAAQLASAVATLAGKGGEGIIGKLRKSTGLDDLDISTDASGNAQLKAGKYLSQNLYTDVTVAGDGTSEINLNLDVNKNVTARGTVGSDGKSGIGIYYERNY